MKTERPLTQSEGCLRCAQDSANKEGWVRGRGGMLDAAESSVALLLLLLFKRCEAANRRRNSGLFACVCVGECISGVTSSSCVTDGFVSRMR